MLSNYIEMHPESRVWIYQSNRPLTAIEVDEVKKAGNKFVEEWTAHNQQLKAAFEVRHNRFLILLVDETHHDASGCSIDKSVKFIQQVEQSFNISLMNRMLFAYQQADAIEICTKDEFEQLFKKGIINENTIVFNNLVQTKLEFESSWKVPLKNSWHKQLI